MTSAYEPHNLGGSATETEPKTPKPKLLGTLFLKEPIGTYFAGTEFI
jgi:hypothetical protein